MVAEKPTTIAIHVHPNARRTEIARFAEGVWYIRVAAPAVEGKANEALLRFLSEVLGVSKTSLTIKRGTTGRWKAVSIVGLTQEEATKRLESGLRTAG